MGKIYKAILKSVRLFSAELELSLTFLRLSVAGYPNARLRITVVHQSLLTQVQYRHPNVFIRILSSAKIPHTTKTFTADPNNS